MKQTVPAEAKANRPFLSDVKVLRDRARRHLQRGAPETSRLWSDGAATHSQITGAFCDWPS